jgi:hypothetical protein
LVKKRVFSATEKRRPANDIGDLDLEERQPMKPADN